MEKQPELRVALGDAEPNRELNRVSRNKDGGIGNPIRKQPPEDRRKYMRDYMRDYRLRRPGLSTPYVRKFRVRKNSNRT
jgi:hypothetical protein